MFIFLNNTGVYRMMCSKNYSIDIRLIFHGGYSRRGQGRKLNHTNVNKWILFSAQKCITDSEGFWFEETSTFYCLIRPK